MANLQHFFIPTPKHTFYTMSYNQKLFITTDKEVPTYEKNLSICLTTDGFSFSITNDKGHLLTLGSIACHTKQSMTEWSNTIKECFNAHKLPLFGYNSARLIISTQQFAWVPDHLYQEGNDRQYLDLVSGSQLGQGIFTEHNEQIKAHIVFAADNTVVSAFKITIPRIHIGCQHSAFVSEHLLQQSDLKSLMLINVRQGVTDFMVLCNKKLQISNTYTTTNTQETIYYGLNLMKQLRLEEATMDTLVCGAIDRESFNQAARFFPNTALYCGRPYTFVNQELHLVHTYRYPEILS